MGTNIQDTVEWQPLRPARMVDLDEHTGVVSPLRATLRRADGLVATITVVTGGVPVTSRITELTLRAPEDVALLDKALTSVGLGKLLNSAVASATMFKSGAGWGFDAESDPETPSVRRQRRPKLTDEELRATAREILDYAVIGLPVAEIATRMSYSRSSMYRLLDEAEKRGLITPAEKSAVVNKRGGE